MARPESCSCITTTLSSTAHNSPVIPKIRPPPQSPRRSRPSSTHSSYSFNPDHDVDFISFDSEPPKPHAIRRCSKSLRLPNRSSHMKRALCNTQAGSMIVLPNKSPEPIILFPPTESRSVPHQSEPLDSFKWKLYVEASFPLFEHKEDLGNSVASKVTDQPTRPNLHHVTKMKNYAKLIQQSSLEEATTSDSVVEKRKRFLVRKQARSAPDDELEVEADEGRRRGRRVLADDDDGGGGSALCIGGRCRSRGSDCSIQPPAISKLIVFVLECSLP